MKKIVAYLFIALAFTACKNDDDNNTGNPIDQLPAMTTTGENTFGCLVNGEVFIPGGGINPLDCVYQFVNGGYYFGLQGNKRDENNHSNLIGLLTNDLQLQENNTYTLAGNIPANASGTYALAGIFSYTSSVNSGDLIITKLDTENQIVSGTFWFDVEHPITRELLEIREGRFDMQYTQ